MRIERGFRDKAEKYFDVGRPFIVSLETQGNAVYDTCCFGVDANDRISDENFTVFYNQPCSPCNAICFRKNGVMDEYIIDINNLPIIIAKMVFTVSIDGNGKMGDIGCHFVRIVQDNNIMLELMLSGSDFQNEKAIIDLEIYMKNEWRINAIARGFDGGLDALVTNYGGELSGDTSAQNQSPDSAHQNISQPVPPQNSVPPQNPVPNASSEQMLADKVMGRISLSKDKVNLEKHVISLSKCVIGLEKKSGAHLSDLHARVVVALDYSGSMMKMFNTGIVQKTLNRLVPLGLTFDDNGSIDLYLFKEDFRKFPDLCLQNYENYVEGIIRQSGYTMGGTNYTPVLESIIYGQINISSEPNLPYCEPVVNNMMPTFVLFITDGENGDRMETDILLKNASKENVFIQFIGIGDRQFKYLMSIDNLNGRVRDNTGFSQLNDIDMTEDSQLYDIILSQFSNWLKGMQ